MRRRLSMALAALLAGATGAAATTRDGAVRDAAAGDLPPETAGAPDSIPAKGRGGKGSGDESRTVVARLEARG